MAKVAPTSRRGGSKPGERRGGRKAGTPNKSTVEVKELARVHGPAAIEKLREIMDGAESEAARVAAAREILDRAYGKSAQPLTGGDEDDASIRVAPDLSGLTVEQLRVLACIPIR